MLCRSYFVVALGLVLGSPHWIASVACSELEDNALRLRKELTLLRRSRLRGCSIGNHPTLTASPEVLERTAEPEPEELEPSSAEYTGKRWNLESTEGGSNKAHRWREKKGGGTYTRLGAILFILMIGGLPVLLGMSVKTLTKTQIFESALLYVWLLGGLHLFTQVLIFQSPHFERPRSLSLEEAVYLYAQILTTVGYGDITPARPRGQLFVGIFVLLAVLIIATMVTEMLELFQSMMDRRMRETEKTENPAVPQEADADQRTKDSQMLKEAFEPVIYSSLVFCCFVLFGSVFFTLYPGEDKTFAQGVYMSLVTLSSVGFGAFTPTTHAGMVVGAFWMVFGCASLVSVVTSRAAFSLALKEHEIRVMEKEFQLKRGSDIKKPSHTKAFQERQHQKDERSELWN